MLTEIGPSNVILLAADASSGGPPPSWWEITSGLLLVAAGVYATWAQFIYPKLAERKAKRDGRGQPHADPPKVDPVIFLVREQSELIDGLRDELARANRLITRNAGTIARLEAELAECRRNH